jgi:hypothetical protein
MLVTVLCSLQADHFWTNPVLYFQVLKGNLRLLFCSDPLTREEALSRITWLMAREERAYEKLPDFSSLRGLLLNSVCLTDRPVDLGHSRIKQHFYQVMV